MCRFGAPGVNVELEQLENGIQLTCFGITFDAHIELLFLFVFWIPLLASFQKSIYFTWVQIL